MADPYVYPGTSVLRNRLGLMDPATLNAAESDLATLGLRRLQEKPLKLPIGVPRLKATHKAIFGEVYPWAGEFRENTGSMRKWRDAGYAVVYGPSNFVAPEMDRIFTNLKRDANLRGLFIDRFAAKTAFYYGD